MKIFVTSNFQETKSDLKSFAAGVKFLDTLGHNIIKDSDFKGSAKNRFIPIQKAIKNIDILLVEVSNTDLKCGFDIAKALSEKKIVIALKKESSKNESFDYLNTKNSRNLMVVEYTNDNIEKKLEQALEEAKKIMDTKFILIISPEIDRYLDWAATNKRMHKAQVVRDAMESMIKKDKGYKSYLEE